MIILKYNKLKNMDKQWLQILTKNLRKSIVFVVVQFIISHTTNILRIYDSVGSSGTSTNVCCCDTLVHETKNENNHLKRVQQISLYGI